MRACVVGSGAREHALCEVLARSVDVVATPGNPGITGHSKEGHSLSSSPAPPGEIEADLYVIGPEAPLVDGLADKLRAAGHKVFGPGADGARLEGSKHFMKELAETSGVPTARWACFSSAEKDAALSFLESLPGGYVVKTDGLAAGKGVLVTSDLEEAKSDVAAKLSGAAFGQAGERVVIEEALEGPELSLFVLCDGKDFVALVPSQDYKRLGTGDTGPNTGGMGSYAPVPAVSPVEIEQILEGIVAPSLAGLKAQGIDYRGTLYAGLMLTPDGPRLIEFNVRFGDPETEVVLPLLESDLYEVLEAAADGDIGRVKRPVFSDQAAVCVVAASPGYPVAPRTGDPISGLTEASSLKGVHIFHAGTTRDASGTVRTAGGRVLAVTALGDGLAEARESAYRALEVISFEGMQARRDIATAPLGGALEPR
jgi:phosphoribosylamine--glycine ligase